MLALQPKHLTYKDIISGGGTVQSGKRVYIYKDVEMFFDAISAVSNDENNIIISNKGKKYKYDPKTLDIEILKGNRIFLFNREINRIKSKMYNKCANTFNYKPTIICIGSGRGGDILKMNKYSKVLFVEPNLDNLKELKRRLLHPLNKRKIQYKWKILNTVGQEGKMIIKEATTFFDKKPDVLSFMLSLSFFNLEDEEQLNNLKYMAHSCKRVMYLTIDKELLLENYNEDQRFDLIDVKLEKVDKELTLNEKVNKSYVDYIFTIHIPDSIVTKQEEYLISSSFLAKSIGGEILFEGYTRNEKFLTQDELWLSKLYYYYIIDVSSGYSNKDSKRE